MKESDFDITLVDILNLLKDIKNKDLTVNINLSNSSISSTNFMSIDKSVHYLLSAKKLCIRIYLTLLTIFINIYRKIYFLDFLIIFNFRKNFLSSNLLFKIKDIIHKYKKVSR